MSGLRQADPPGSLGVPTPQKASSKEVVTSSPLGPHIGCARRGLARPPLPVWQSECEPQHMKAGGPTKGKYNFP